jgi:hypothetical protein
MNGNKLTITLLTFGIFLLLTIVIFYLLKFGSLNLSDELNDWVNFSNYFSGILNPIYTLLNLIIFAYLSFQLIKIEDTRNRWTLQELARPFGNLHYENTYDSIEIRIENIGLGPLILTNFRVFKDSNKPYKNFYELVNYIADKENVSHEIDMKINFYVINGDSGAIAKDKSISIFKLYFLDDNQIENRQFIDLMRKELNKYTICFTCNDMYGRKIKTMKERIYINDIA